MREYENHKEFAALWDSCRGDTQLILKSSVSKDMRNLMRKRRNAEAALGIRLKSKKEWAPANFPLYDNVLIESKKELSVIVGSDRHCWPGEEPKAVTVLKHVIEDIKPDYFIINGDWFDFPKMSKHPVIGWEDRPEVSEELDDGISLIKEIKKLSPRTKIIFIPGNHDSRFDNKIAATMPELNGVKGTSFRDYLPVNDIGLSATVNDTLIIKHDWHGGIHAAYNNVLRGGKSIATGHTHHLMIRPYTDYSGKRYGIECGMLSDMWDDSFSYVRNNSVDWQPGFAHIQIADSLIVPQTIHVEFARDSKYNGRGYFNGKWYG